jgi:hypothetical protein
MRRLGNHNVPIFTINTIGQAIIKPPKFKVQDLLKEVNIKNRTDVRTLYFLEKGGVGEGAGGRREEETVFNLPADIAVSKAIENSDDAFLFPPYKEMLHYIKIGSKSAQDLLAEERNILQKFLSDINCLTIKSESRSWYKKIVIGIAHKEVS